MKIKLALVFLSLFSSEAGADAYAECAKTFQGRDAERLKCFDEAERGQARQIDAVPVQLVQPVAQSAPQPVQSEDIPMPQAIPVREKVADARSYLTRAWNLDNHIHRDPSSLDRLQPYRQSYLIVRESNHPNKQPTSPGVGNTVVTPYDLDALEAKYQLSFKSDIGTIDGLDLWGLKTVRFWGAYTQQSNWQVFNARNSSPFRETNYEPELIAAFSTGNATGWKLLNLGMLHQSNGRSQPESRSWNRLYAQGGWEWGNTSILARGWWRVPENALKDDNPDIVHYLGRGDVVLRWEPESRAQAVSLLMRNNLNMNQNLGFMQLDWSLPVAIGHAARVHAQMTSGYGESLIDYNHRQTTFGLGVSFREW